LGGNIAANLITWFYAAALIAVVFEPIVFILKKRHIPKRK
jgi:predicted PurR-regulated permease PerM